MEVRQVDGLDEMLQDLLVCPSCNGNLEWLNLSSRCTACMTEYPIIDGIPVMLPASGIDGSDIHKEAQRQFFDHHAREEFETNRPHGTPRLYSWLLEEKFRRSMQGIPYDIAGSLALTVCGGSGMDAEFLSRRNLRVISSDLSLGAAKRVKERSRRFDLPIVPVVADVERLPFPDTSFDLVYVHDGLHHLSDPMVGLAEMARVSCRALSLTEPARALVTSVAVRLGMADAVEEAGNRVARISAEQVEETLLLSSFRPVTIERYAMYYHGDEPGQIFSLLSRSGIFPLMVGFWRLLNAAIGRLGNKLTVNAVRVGLASEVNQDLELS